MSPNVLGLSTPRNGFTAEDAPRALALLGVAPGAGGPFETWKALQERYGAYGRSLHLALDLEGARQARLSVFVNSRLAGGVAYFGLLELPEIGGVEAVRALLREAEPWCARAGATRLRGPIAYSTWYPYRCVVSETNPQPFPGDSPYRASLAGPLGAAGFRQAGEYFSAITGPLGKFVARIEPVARHARAKGIEFSLLQGSAIPALFDEAHQLSQTAFAPNHSFTPIGREEFVALFSYAPRLPDVAVLAARGTGGELLGFVFGYGAPGFQWDADPGARVAVLKSIAADPRVSDSFCGAALSATLHRHFLDCGYGRVIHALMARERHARSALVEGFRTYAIFEKDVAP